MLRLHRGWSQMFRGYSVRAALPHEIKVVDRSQLPPNETNKHEVLFTVDRSRLKEKTYQSETAPGKEPETELAKQLKTRIKAAGPLSVSTFMNEALTNNLHGYYRTGSDEKIFGKQGDFVTSPEVSQMFGEMIAIWVHSILSTIDTSTTVHLVELGPGRATLMHDVLQTLKRLKVLPPKMSVHLVEVSTSLRELQKNRLGDSITKPELGSLPTQWHDTIQSIPNDGTVIFIAHEFFDALPVYQFQYTNRGWSEVMVDVDQTQETQNHFKFVFAPGESIASKVFEKHLERFEKKVGNRAELAINSLAIIQQMAERIKQQSGAALIIDYGKAIKEGFTLRGILKHQFVDILTQPGDVDLSVDVDWEEIKVHLTDSKTITTFGPQTQKHFLQMLGIDVRLMSLLKNPNTPDETKQQLIAAYSRLTEDMGEIYRALCFVDDKISKKLNNSVPGFEQVK